MTPFYQHLSGIPGFQTATPIDKVGLWATAGVGAAFAAHGLIALLKRGVTGAPSEPPPPAEKTPEDKGGQP
jgi:hypothetical protein